MLIEMMFLRLLFLMYFSAWVRAENLCPYLEHKDRLSKAAKGQKFKKAMDAIEEAITQEANKVRFQAMLFNILYQT